MAGHGSRRGGRRNGGGERTRSKRSPGRVRRTSTKEPPGDGASAEARPAAPPAEPRAREPFPIVGIGASAGGLEALEVFLQNVPEHSGMAFVVVQHLDPSHPAALVELLQRVSPLPVSEVQDATVVEPERVYVIPPNQELAIHGGVLRLLRRDPGARPLPIDHFFRSLAEDRAEAAIGVVLSGMGTDGTLGLRAIRENAGATFVQSLGSAKFDGMPRSAIDAGLADVVAPVEELPPRILTFHRHAAAVRRAERALDEKQHGALEKIFVLLRAQTGNDFSMYKRSTLYRRIERRMGLHQISEVAQYVRYLRENPQEIDLLLKELLIGVTGFFRDPAAWDHLRKVVLPALLAERGDQRVLRAWVPGCSTGEEAYSLAIVAKEAIEARERQTPVQLQIFATDLDTDAIERGRMGSYPAAIAEDVSPERLRRFFVQDERGYRISKEIREAVVFAPQNVIMDPPFTKLDVLSCRNLLIYLAPELQKKLIPLFHYALSPGGVLFLGSAETIGTFTTLFAPLDPKARLYRRVDAPVGPVMAEFPSAFAPGEPGAGEPLREPRRQRFVAPPNLQTIADRVLVQRFAPAALLTTDKGDILYISGRTGRYLEPAVGRANLNVFAMAREGLRHPLASAFAEAVREGRAVTTRGVRVGSNGGTQVVDLTVQKLADPSELRGTVMIVIAEAPPAPEPARRAARRPATATAGRLEELERELEHTREELQTTREEMQTSQEELTSTNEELQSTNEELQSTNEELTTSKEEMQSMNEELQTVNQELQAKVDELSRSNNDMKNLLNSTDIATLFLDGELRVRRFTTQTSRLIKLIPGDAGRPITDLVMDLEYPELAEDAREVLRTLVFRERQAEAGDGRWFSVRILPYRTLDNVIDGVVITFTDVTAAKHLEANLRDQAQQLRQILESLPALTLGCRADGSCEFLSRPWLEYTGLPEAEQLGYGWLEQIHPEDRDRVREEWRRAVRTGDALDIEFRLRRHDGAYRWFTTRAVPTRDAAGNVARWYATSTDVDDRRR